MPDATVSTMPESFTATKRKDIAQPAMSPYLCVPDARAAIDWYSVALGGSVVGEPIVTDDGRIGHAEIEIGGGTLYLADEYPEMGLKAPVPKAVSVSFLLRVQSTDTTLQRARAHGAAVEREIYQAHGSRNATIIDPFGHRWLLSGPIGTPDPHDDVA
ncbi:VOC family protein [Mycobacterium sp.]|uniref:VOC family protein n=1 Tax=Mycobacterium sp. TaxID=1785 RepID=UPI003A88ACF3